LTNWVASPNVAVNLSQLKGDAGSNEPLPQPGATQPGRRRILGTLLLASLAWDDATIWGVPQAFSFVVQAQQATLDVDSPVYVSSDRRSVRSTLRLAFGWRQPAAVIKIVIGS
jgi:hypothetical protein